MNNQTYSNPFRYIIQSLLLCWFVFYAVCLQAQCPTGNISLKTQAEVDNFIIQYPNCTELDRLDVTQGTDIVNVNGLRNLTKINGDLNITHNPVLTDLSGFNNIKSTGYLWIANNSSFTDLNAFPELENAYWLVVNDHVNLETISGFNKLQSVTNLSFKNNSILTSASEINALTQVSGVFEIENNPMLEYINFATNLTQIGGNTSLIANNVLQELVTMDGITSINGRLNISNNSSLSNLSAFSSLSTINGQLIIEGNTVLKNIFGIQNLAPSSINTLLKIVNNPVLSFCDLPNLCSYLANPSSSHPRNISGNAGNCASEQAVTDACNAVLEGDACSDAINIAGLFGHPVGEVQSTGAYTTQGYDGIGDPSIGPECFGQGMNTIWFTFVGDGQRYALRSNYCGEFVDAKGALYSGDCSNLVFIICHNNISISDEDPDANFYIEFDTEIGVTYHLMVEAGNEGEFCLAVTKLAEPCNVSIPDPNFNNYLLNNTEINTNGDSFIQCMEAEIFNGSINCPFKDISDLTGIEAFVNLSRLDCGGNKLTNLDLSKNINLQELAAGSNNLNTLNLTNCNILERVYIENNNLTQLQLSTNVNLKLLHCQINQLLSLELSNNANLNELVCNNNKLTALNLKNGNNTSISSIKSNNNPDLTCIQVDDAAYSTSNWIGGNFIFDSQHHFKEDCGAPNDGEYCINSITIENMFGHAEGETQSSGLYSAEGYNNLNDPNFGHDCISQVLSPTIWFHFTGDGFRYSIKSSSCGQISDPAGALYEGNCANLSAVVCDNDISTSDVDPDANFYFEFMTEPGKEYNLMVQVSLSGEFCLEVTKLGEECLVNIPDGNFKSYLVNNNEINTNGDQEIQCKEAEKYIGSINCSALGIKSLIGVEAFINLVSLDCGNNQLTTLNLNRNTNLNNLYCGNNQLTSLTLDSLPQLGILQCSGNSLASLKVSANPWLYNLDVRDNNIKTLNLSLNQSLVEINVSSNDLKYLNLANGNNEAMTNVQTNNNPDLTCIQVDNPVYCLENWLGVNYTFDSQQMFNTFCTPCINDNEITANFLFASSACSGDDVRIIEYGVLDSIPEQINFSWDFGNGQTSNERDPIVKYSEPGTFTVTLELTNIECPLSIQKSIEILPCFKQNNVNKYASVFPNPTTGLFNLKINLPEEENVSVSIYNVQGREIWRKYYDQENNIQEKIDGLTNGIYIVKVQYSYGAECIKIIILD